MQAKLGQIPKFWHSPPVPIAVLDRSARQWQIPNLKNDDEFSSLVKSFIPTQIPKAYLEGYLELISLIENMPWPKCPKLIFTSNAYSSDDVFKVWAAKQVEFGTPLVIGQHGGNYGMALWGFTENHQIAIADRFLTWGWSEADCSKITPVGNFKGFGKKCSANKAGYPLLVEMTLPRQSYHMYSVPVAAGQWLDYFEEQCRFLNALPPSLRDLTLVRLYSHDYKYCQMQRWQERFPNVHLDEGYQPMSKLLKGARA